MSSDAESLNYLGKFLMKNLRDSALEHFEGIAKGHWKVPGLKRLQRDIAQLSEDQQEIVRQCVKDAVDNGIHDFLFSLHEETESEGRIQLSVDDKAATDLSDGLHGEIFTEDGWGARFSNHGEPES